MILFIFDIDEKSIVRETAHFNAGYFIKNKM